MRNKVVLTEMNDANGEFAVIVRTDCYESVLHKTGDVDIVVAVAKSLDEAHSKGNQTVEFLKTVPASLFDVRDTEFSSKMSSDLWRTYSLKPEFVGLKASHEPYTKVGAGSVTTKKIGEGFCTFIEGIYSNEFGNILVAENYKTMDEAYEGHQKWARLMENPPETLVDKVDNPALNSLYEIASSLTGTDARVYRANHITKVEVAVETIKIDNTEFEKGFNAKYLTMVKGYKLRGAGDGDGDDITAVEVYQTKEEAIDGHARWEEYMSTAPLTIQGIAPFPIPAEELVFECPVDYSSGNYYIQKGRGA